MSAAGSVHLMATLVGKNALLRDGGQAVGEVLWVRVVGEKGLGDVGKRDEGVVGELIAIELESVSGGAASATT